MIKRYFLGALTTVALTTAAFAWTNPGILNSESYLDKVANFTEASNPSTYRAYNNYRTIYTDTKLLFASNYAIKGPCRVVLVKRGEDNACKTAFIDDAFAAYYNALRWVVDGDAAALAKSKSILDQWSATFEDMDVVPGSWPDQDQNMASWFIPIWANTAEVLRSYKRPNDAVANWSTTSQAQFTVFMDRLWREVETAYVVRSDGEGMNNITASANMAGMAYWIWKRQSFGEKVAEHRNNIKKLIPMLVHSTGEVNEFYRDPEPDCNHPQYTMIAFMQAGWIEKNQFNTTTILDYPDSDGKPLLVKGLNYIGARFVDGGGADQRTRAWDCRTSKNSNNRIFDGYAEIAVRYYGVNAIAKFIQAYNLERSFTSDNPAIDGEANPARTGFFPDILRVTHGPQ